MLVGIDQGIRSGQLSVEEVDIVQDNLNHVKFRMARMRSDGELSPQEKQRLHEMPDENNALIYKKKHNFRRLY